MATIFRDTSGKVVWAEQAVDPCDVCGEPADAAWYGKANIHVCQECAINALPKLIADAIEAKSNESNEVSRFARFGRQMLQSYFRGVAVAVGHIRQERERVAAEERYARTGTV